MGHTAHRIDRIGNIGLGFILVALVFLLPIAASQSPVLVLAIPVVICIVLLGTQVVQYPVLHLASVLAFFVVVARFEEGFQLSEALYGLYFVSFLAIWFFRTLFSSNDYIFSSTGKLLLLFASWVFLSIGMTMLFGGSLRGATSEGIALLFLGLFFPVSDAVSKSESGLKIILTVVVGIGVVVVVRNLFIYLQAFESAVYVYEIARGRVITNEVLILAPAVIALAYYALLEMKRPIALIAWAVHALLFTGLLVTQSRTYWLAYGLAVMTLFLMMGMRGKKRILFASLSTLTALGISAFVLIPDYVILVVAGLVERLTSIGSAASSDISLINRFMEAGAVIDKILTNPIVGHGMGSTYRFYDITFELSREKSFVHNGYLALWFKFGIVGLGLALAFLGSSLRSAFATIRDGRTSPIVKVGAVSALAILCSLLLSSLATNPFYLSDTTFIIGVASGVAVGSHRLLSSGQTGDRDRKELD